MTDALQREQATAVRGAASAHFTQYADRIREILGFACALGITLCVAWLMVSAWLQAREDWREYMEDVELAHRLRTARTWTRLPLRAGATYDEVMELVNKHAYDERDIGSTYSRDDDLE